MDTYSLLLQPPPSGEGTGMTPEELAALQDQLSAIETTLSGLHIPTKSEIVAELLASPPLHALALEMGATEVSEAGVDYRDGNGTRLAHRTRVVSGGVTHISELLGN